MDLTFEEWLVKYNPRMAALYAYAKSPLPNDIGERHVDIEKGIHMGDEAGRLLADADSYLTNRTAQAILTCRDLNPDLNADERRAMVKDAVRKEKRLVDGLEVTAQTIKDRIYAHLNANRSR